MCCSEESITEETRGGTGIWDTYVGYVRKKYFLVGSQARSSSAQTY